MRPGSTSRLREPVTGRQERPNSSTRSHDPITDIWKKIRHDYLEETSGCACLGARRDCASIAKLRAGSRPRHQRERSYDSLGATDFAATSAAGTICLSSSSHFPLRPYSNIVNPVALPLGRARLATNPAPTGSMTTTIPKLKAEHDALAERLQTYAPSALGPTLGLAFWPQCTHLMGAA